MIQTKFFKVTSVWLLSSLSWLLYWESSLQHLTHFPLLAWGRSLRYSCISTLSMGNFVFIQMFSIRLDILQTVGIVSSSHLDITARILSRHYRRLNHDKHRSSVSISTPCWVPHVACTWVELMWIGYYSGCSSSNILAIRNAFLADWQKWVLTKHWLFLLTPPRLHSSLKLPLFWGLTNHSPWIFTQECRLSSSDCSIWTVPNVCLYNSL